MGSKLGLGGEGRWIGGCVAMKEMCIIVQSWPACWENGDTNTYYGWAVLDCRVQSAALSARDTRLSGWVS